MFLEKDRINCPLSCECRVENRAQRKRPGAVPFNRVFNIRTLPLSGSLGTKHKIGKQRQINCILHQSKGKFILKKREKSVQESGGEIY